MVGVVPVEDVSALAVGLRGVASRRTLPAEDIDFVGNGLEMGRIDARPITAEVVKRQPIGDGPHYGFLSEPVSEDVVAIHAEPSVSSTGCVAFPDPALSRVF